MAKRVILYKGDEVREMWADKADKFLADGWSFDKPEKRQAKTKKSAKTETNETEGS